MINYFFFYLVNIDFLLLILIYSFDFVKELNYLHIGFYYDKDRIVTLTNKYCEPDEVDDVKFIPIDELDNYEWTSENHKEKIKEYGKYIVENHSAARTINRMIYQGEEKAKTWINFNYDIRTR